MFKIIRLYNRNRKLVWFIIIVAIFCIAIINIINNEYKNQAKINNEKIIEQMKEEASKKNPSEIVDYKEASKSLTSGETVDKEIRDEIQQTLENFIQFVCNQQVEQAFQLLTEDCKSKMYPSIDFFKQNYCQDLYKKTYTFQSWSFTNNEYVYQVRFYENMLSSGINRTNNYLEDYITVIKKGTKYLLNINKYINSELIQQEKEYNNIIFKVKSVETYLDYQIYDLEITNNNLDEIILDTRKEDNSIYVKNSDGLKIRALLYENTDEDLIVKAGETKNIKIKFNNTYNVDKHIVSIGFSDIIINQRLFQEDTSKGKMEIEINLR